MNHFVIVADILNCPNPLLFYQQLQSFYRLFTGGQTDAILGASLILSHSVASLGSNALPFT